MKRTFGEGFTKELRQMPDGEFSRYVIETMENWMFLKKIADDRQVILYPAIGKLDGQYPKEYEAQLKEKVKDEKTKNKKEGDKG